MLDSSLPCVELLKAQPWLAALEDSRREAILAGARRVFARKGEWVLRAGERAEGLYAVVDGLVKIQSLGAGGRRSTFLGVSSGEWFGEGSVIKAEPRQYDVVALRDSELLCVPKRYVDELKCQSLLFNQALVAQLNRRLGQAMAVIEAGRTRSPTQRVALCLSQLFWRGSREIAISQEELGELAGLSRQTVNRSLHEIACHGWIAVQFGRISIRDQAAVLRLASSG